MTIIKKLSLLLAIALFVCAGFACETAEGAGEDIENLGENIEDAAD